MTSSPIILSRGFDEAERPRVAALFWEAFRAKLGPVMRPEDSARAFLAEVADPAYALTARGQDGALLGLAGFKTAQGAFIGGTYQDLSRHYGPLGAVWRGIALSFLERDLEDNVLLMDGIFVDAAARGRGIGGQLLDAITQEAEARGLETVRLDVIDTNPRARALYARKGFVAVGTEQTGPLRHVFGFRSATRMERRVTG